MLIKVKHRLWGTILLLFPIVLLQVTTCLGRRIRNLDDFELESSYPRFAQPIPNVTVTVGKDALLPCVVDNLDNYKVAWVRVDTQTILTIYKDVITRDPRISLVHSDHRSWFLQITSTKEDDTGWYMCQLNTDPMRSITGYLDVVVPPEIIDKETSTDMVVREGSNVTLTCKAKGHPEPYIMWRREDNREIHYNGNMVNVIDGEVFQIVRVSRLHMGAYLCIASNGIPPSISKRVMLKVQFPPMMTISHQLEARYKGEDITLECKTEAYPKSINYWTNDKGDMIVSGNKYEAYLVEEEYKMYMRLKIRNLEVMDFGDYVCVAKNSLGTTDGTIKLRERASPPTTTARTTPLTTPIPLKKFHWNEKKRINEVIREREFKRWNSGKDPHKYDDFDDHKRYYTVDRNAATISSTLGITYLTLLSLSISYFCNTHISQQSLMAPTTTTKTRDIAFLKNLVFDTNTLCLLFFACLSSMLIFIPYSFLSSSHNVSLFIRYVLFF